MKIHDLKLHETTLILSKKDPQIGASITDSDLTTTVTRVPGGWIYTVIIASHNVLTKSAAVSQTFVPYSEEFKNELQNDAN